MYVIDYHALSSYIIEVRKGPPTTSPRKIKTLKLSGMDQSTKTAYITKRGKQISENQNTTTKYYQLTLSQTSPVFYVSTLRVF